MGYHELSLPSIIEFLTYGVTFNRDTVSNNITCIKPGEYLDIDLTNNQKHSNNYDGPNIHSDLKEHLEFIANSNVVNDVPLGLFLSGGIDSSILSYFVKEKVDKAFTLGFSFADDEVDDAAITAEFLSIEHFSKICSYEDTKKAALEIGSILDDLIADQSVVPSYLLCRSASKSFKVMLSADGLDELFRGYTRHLKYFRFSKFLRLHISGFLSYLSHFNFFSWKLFQQLSLNDSLYDRLIQRSNPSAIKKLFKNFRYKRKNYL